MTESLKTNPDFSLGLYDRPKHLLDISNYLLEIETNLNNNRFIVIDGIEESGKSTVTSEFTRNNNCFSVYFSKRNKSDYSLNYFFQNLIDQISNHLTFEVKSDPDIKAVYSRLMYKLRQNKKEKIIFIIDGLEHSKEIKFIDEVLELLNLDVPNFSFVFTDNNTLCENNIFKELPIFKIKCLGFGINELKDYYSEYNLDFEELKTIHTITKGIPSRLQIVKDRLADNKSFVDLNIDDKFENWIEKDVENLLNNQDEQINSRYNLILAVVSLSNENFKITELCIGLDENEVEVKALFTLLSTYFDIVDEVIYFKSNLLKELLKKKYNLLKDKVRNIEIQINYNCDTIQNKIRLVKLLFEGKDFDNVIDVFENNFLSNAFNNTQKISTVNELIDAVCKSSASLDKSEALFDYSLQGAILNNIENNIEDEYKILSLISIKEFEEAIITTDLLVSKSNRLYFYSKIAKKQKELNTHVSEVLIEKIDSIFFSLDLKDFGKNLYEIVSDLIIISSKYAMHILNSEDKKDNKSNINDLLFTKLSLASLTINEEEDKNNFSELLNKLENDKSKEINTSLRIFIGNYSYEQLNEEIQNYTDIKERIKLYRYWIENTKENEKIHFVIKNIITEIVNSNSNDFFNLEVLSYISKFIIKISDIKTKLEIAERFSVILDEVEDNGLFINKTFFKLNLFDCYYEHDHSRAINILENLLKEIDSYPDLLTKCESLGLTIEYTFKKQNYLVSIKSKVNSSFSKNFDKLLLETSDQFSPFKRIFKSLSTTSFKLCNEYLNKLNTIYNRDKSRLYIIDQYLENDYININLDSLLEFTIEFEDEVYINIVKKLILERFSTATDLKAIQLNSLKPILNSIDSNLISKTNLIYLKILDLIVILNNSTNKNNFNEISIRKKNILKDIDSLSDNYKKNEFCQIISSKISYKDQKFAREIYLKSCSEVFQFNDLRFKLSILLITNFEAMVTGDLHNQIENDEVKERLEIIIKNITSISDVEDRIELLTRLGFVCYIKKLDSYAKDLYEKIFEIFSTSQRNNPIYNYINTLTYIYIYNNSYISNQINITSLIYEELCFSVAKFYLFKKNPFTIYDSNDMSFNCSFTDVSSSLSLIELLKTDVNIYHMIECVSNLCDYKTIKLTTIQKNSIISRISDVIDGNLPDNLNIHHEGYKIATKIKFHKFSKKYNISDLKNEIDLIPNISDKVFVLSILLENYSTFKTTISRDVIFNEITDGLKQLSNHYEFISRVNDLTDIMSKSTLNPKWKDLLSSAYNLSVNLENKVNSVTSQKKLIDTIYKIDENLAKELVSKGVENSHMAISNIIKRHYDQIQDVKLLNSKDTIGTEDIHKVNVDNFLKSTYINLKNINSNLVTAKKIKDLKVPLLIASKIPLEDSLIVYDGYFRNISSANYAKNEIERVKDIILKNFEAIKNSFSIIDIISKLHESKSGSNLELLNFESNSVIIMETERTKALSVFKDWIIEEAEEYIYIVDPYFETKDTEILNLIQKADKGLDIKVLCCNYFSKEDFKTEWKTISKEDLEDCEFIFSYFKHNHSLKPLHDRFLLSKNSGLRLGTSLNSIGSSNKFSEISRMGSVEVSNLLSATLNDFLNGVKKEVNGERLSRERYYLD